MSAVIKIAVEDGIVLGTDSRSTNGDDKGRKRTFDGVKKLFVFRDDFPAAVMTWGQNRLGRFSVEHLLQEACVRFRGESDEHKDWTLDPKKTTVAEIAKRISGYLFHDYYQPAVEKGARLDGLSIHVAGFSPGKDHPEHVEYKLTPEHILGPHAGGGQQVQVNFDAPYIARIMTGVDPRMLALAASEGLDKEKLKSAGTKFGRQALHELIASGMPLQEVAALIRCLLNTEISLNRLGFDPDVIGGDIQMVVVDRNGCNEMLFRPIDFQIPQTVWKYGNVKR